jgi:hypothetical protein
LRRRRFAPDVVPSHTTAESKEMPDRRGHVAASMDSEVFRKSLLGDQRTNRALIVFLDGAFTLIARHADWGGRLLCVINDRGIPSFAEEDRHDQQC